MKRIKNVIVDDVPKEDIKCFFCERDLSLFSYIERTSHVNSCMESSKNDFLIAKEVEKSNSQEMKKCEICFKSLENLNQLQVCERKKKVYTLT
jgi:hypothetical protein